MYAYRFQDNDIPQSVTIIANNIPHAKVLLVDHCMKTENEHLRPLCFVQPKEISIGSGWIVTYDNPEYKYQKECVCPPLCTALS